MKDRLFPQLHFVTLAEHIVDADLISLDPIASRCVDAEAFLLLDPLAQEVSFQESYPSVRPEPKSYPWLLNARQVHIAVLLVAMVENITDDVLEEFISADLGNGARSSQVGRVGMPWLALETASEGLVEVVYSLKSLSIQSSPIVVDALSLTLHVELLIQMVIDPALDILPRSARACLKAVVPLGYAEVRDRCGGGSVVEDRVVVSRTTSVVVKDKDAIHVVLIVMSPDRGLPTESPWLDLYVRSRSNVEIAGYTLNGRQTASIPG